MAGKTALLIIHGIGEQKPFESLNDFVKTFNKCYYRKFNAKYPGQKFDKIHQLHKIADWIDSAVCFHSCAGIGQIDIYEYYWSYLAQKEITAGEIVDWIFQVAKGARSFYKSGGSKNSNDQLFKRDGEFKYYKYLITILSFGNIFKIFWAIGVFLKVIRLSVLSRLLLSFLTKFAEKYMIDFLGDITFYTTTDKKSSYFDVRKKILDGAVEQARNFILSDEYDRLILIGHSLGSVIAYDLLARLNKEMNVDPVLKNRADKIKGLVTFGSPLDKIAFFFDEKVDKISQPIRYAIITQLYGFRRNFVPKSRLTNGIKQYFDDVPWLNFWCVNDPVSGHLDVYSGVENQLLDFSKKIKSAKWSPVYPVLNHLYYWQSEQMHDAIIDKFDLV